MKKVDDIGLFQCRYVSDLFIYSTKQKDCSSKVFIKAFVHSTLSKRIANKAFMFESLDITGAYALLKKEKKLSRGKEIYPSYAMAWIGYIMQYFSCVTGLSMSVLYRKVKPNELYALYEAYHSLDNELAVRRICEAKGINI